MTRWLQYPVLFTALVLLWLLLNQSIAPGQILLGAIVAAVASWAMSALEQPRPHIRNVDSVVRLAGRVLRDIVRSNIAVIQIVLGRKSAASSAGFLSIPLDLRNRYGLATLALIITATPGTTWVNYDSRRSELLLHVLDLHNEDAWRLVIKQRYESLLMEIFE